MNKSLYRPNNMRQNVLFSVTVYYYNDDIDCFNCEVELRESFAISNCFFEFLVVGLFQQRNSILRRSKIWATFKKN